MDYILITGVSTGIGHDALGFFYNLGFHVFGSVRKSSDAERLTAEFPHHFTCLQFDVTDIEKIDSAKNTVEKVLAGKPLCALVNNAGFALGGPLELLNDDSFRKQIEVNLFGVRNVINAFLPFLGASKSFTQKPGKIINISSISGVLNTPMNGAYCISKHAMESMGEVYRRELMMYGIQVVSIQPGPIESKLWDKNSNSMAEFLDSDYKQYARNADRIMHAAQKDALPAGTISSLIHHIITHKKPKLSYIVTKNKWINTIVAKYLPGRIVDYFLYKSMSK